MSLSFVSPQPSVMGMVAHWTTNLKAMQNQMMAMNRVANLSSADTRDATFLSTWDKHAVKSNFTILPGERLAAALDVSVIGTSTQK